MSKLTRTLALVAMLAAMAVTGMTAVAQAHVADQAVRQDARRPALCGPPSPATGPAGWLPRWPCWSWSPGSR